MLRGVTLKLCTQALVFLVAIGHGGATVINRTIDDEFGDSATGEKPIFLPSTQGIWAGEECGGCRVQPDRALAFKGTWKAATYRNEEPGGKFTLTGTAIYVFFITGNQIAGGIITTLTECNFTLDGQQASFYRHIPDQTTILNYNVLAFSRENLPNVDHTLKASTEGVDHHVFVNFDYAIYT
ncbi:hypothetical protein BDZ94DRAFT_1163882 [Collybia nuda]|uniref:Uncharacterized protein n=1 Tax=Collybia nuda TaxID=64659 RepID=A0A9P5Y564_9AGAR|nr:hypothetical protein BDZ94DRAFT_1163882 [Collybia nuda]